jgi:hypothetical protein
MGPTGTIGLPARNHEQRGARADFMDLTNLSNIHPRLRSFLTQAGITMTVMAVMGLPATIYNLASAGLASIANALRRKNVKR